MNAEARAIVTALGLEPLPQEGGFFRQTWRSAAGSAIYFLLTSEDFSALHRLRTSDEVWHFYAGDEVEHTMLLPAGCHELSTPTVGQLAGERSEEFGRAPASGLPTTQTKSMTAAGKGVVRVTTLGGDVRAGAVPQLVVPAGAWQGARLAASGQRGWALLGCTLAPAWDERDFELGDRAALLREFPGAAAHIGALTR